MNWKRSALAVTVAGVVAACGAKESVRVPGVDGEPLLVHRAADGVVEVHEDWYRLTVNGRVVVPYERDVKVDVRYERVPGQEHFTCARRTVTIRAPNKTNFTNEDVASNVRRATLIDDGCDAQREQFVVEYFRGGRQLTSTPPQAVRDALVQAYEFVRKKPYLRQP